MAAGATDVSHALSICEPLYLQSCCWLLSSLRCNAATFCSCHRLWPHLHLRLCCPTMLLPSAASSFPLAKLIVLAVHESPKAAAARTVWKELSECVQILGQGWSLAWRSESGPSCPSLPPLGNLGALIPAHLRRPGRSRRRQLP